MKKFVFFSIALIFVYSCKSTNLTKFKDNELEQNQNLISYITIETDGMCCWPGSIIDGFQFNGESILNDEPIAVDPGNHWIQIREIKSCFGRGNSYRLSKQVNLEPGKKYIYSVKCKYGEPSASFNEVKN